MLYFLSLNMNLYSLIKHFIKNDTNKETQIKWSLYIRVWKEFGVPYWKLLLLGVVFTVIAAGAEGYAITLVKKMIDEGFIEKNMDSLYLIGLELIGAYCGKSIFTYGKTIFLAKAGLLAAASLRKRLFNHLVRLSFDFFQNINTGPIMNSFTGLASAVLGLVTSSIMSIVQNISTLLIMLCLMFWYAPQITVTLLFLGPTIGVLVTILARKRRAVARKSFSYDAESLSKISEAIIGIKTIQSFCAEDYESERISKIEDDKVKVGMKAASIVGLQSPILEIMISIGLCAAILVGGHFITSGALTTGDFTAFLLAMSAAYKPAKTLTNIGGGIQVGLVAAESLFELFDRKSTINDAVGSNDFKSKQINVSLENVTFAYDLKDGNIISHMNLTVKPGQTCAFVGPSGGGKSTIFNLILRFYDPQEGSIRFNDVDIREIKLNALRNNIAIVSQDVFLFDASIAENIKYGTPDATQDQIEEAAKLANAHNFIMDFPDKYNNKVGERGMLLSGGQKQRIAIARAILRNAPILLLDEATSALDSDSEYLIQEAIAKLMKGRTTFVIAHRLSTILDADIICFIKDGQILEQGTDSELYSLKGYYHKLKDIQFKKRE